MNRPVSRGSPPSARRLNGLGLAHRVERGDPTAGRSPVAPRAEVALRPATRLLGAAMVGATVALVLGGDRLALAAGGGLVASAITWRQLGLLEPAAARARKEAASAELPVAADVLAACLLAGAPLARSISAVGDAFDGPIGQAFRRTGAALTLGASVEEAVGSWAGDPALACLAPVARALVRSSERGSAAGSAVSRVAADLRTERRWRVDAVARRAGVRATAPLGLCFLPAFVLAGVVPVVLAGVRSLAL